MWHASARPKEMTRGASRPVKQGAPPAATECSRTRAQMRIVGHANVTKAAYTCGHLNNHQVEMSLEHPAQ